MSSGSWEAISRSQLPNHRRPVWVQAVIHLIEPYMFPAMLDLMEAIDTGKRKKMTIAISIIYQVFVSRSHLDVEPSGDRHEGGADGICRNGGNHTNPCATTLHQRHPEQATFRGRAFGQLGFCSLCRLRTLRHDAEDARSAQERRRLSQGKSFLTLITSLPFVISFYIGNIMYRRKLISSRLLARPLSIWTVAVTFRS